MFMSQKPSSVDLRVSDFKRIPGFNYVLSVSRRRTTTRTTRCALRSERAKEKIVGDRCPEARARQRAKRKFQRRAVRCGLACVSGHNTVDPGPGSLIAAHNMLWVLWLWGRPHKHNSHNIHDMLWAAMPREP